MKTKYISPDTKIHKLRVESMLAALSDQTKAFWGTDPDMVESEDVESDAAADDDAVIPWVDGDKWGTI